MFMVMVMTTLATTQAMMVVCFLARDDLGTCRGVLSLQSSLSVHPCKVCFCR